MSTALPYEILLRGKPDGTFSGGHVILFGPDGTPGHAQPLGTDDHPWPEALGNVNTALAAQASLVEQVQAAIKSMAEERDKALQEAATAKQALADLDPDIKRAAIEAQKAQIKDAAEKALAKLDRQSGALDAPATT